MKYLNKFYDLSQTTSQEFDDFLSSLKDNQLIMVLNHFYKSEFIKNIKSTLVKFPYIPLEAEDIYVEFLQLYLSEVKKYKSYEKNVKFLNYFLNICKFFTLNKIRYWLRKKRIHNSLMLSTDELIYVLDEDSGNKMNENIESIDVENFYKSLSQKDKGIIEYLKVQEGKKIKLLTPRKLEQFRVNFLEKFNNYFTFAK
ncbi:hypothetical protein NPA07_00660 [Mycoplasmopsis caviae]|uniref:Uncharacterized protein n=1 Tax=Mycoplasmopsis caviae TaxID=55603 RepID=A0A3P8L6Y8_9BACT|nr:hypothetical protein [Mycoplasmopsis caviae]UUD35377.1 hypothetical protein NPA07_00660 [Mycoplasmopsis caviae]VDR41845.1 Uncharacterised protein [Mycoplasmopsis caviae]